MRGHRTGEKESRGGGRGRDTARVEMGD